MTLNNFPGKERSVCANSSLGVDAVQAGGGVGLPAAFLAGVGLPAALQGEVGLAAAGLAAVGPGPNITSI